MCRRVRPGGISVVPLGATPFSWNSGLILRSTLEARGSDARTRRSHRRLQRAARALLPDGPVRTAPGHPLPPRASVEGRLAGRTGRGWYVEACREHAPKVTSRASEGF
jgi:hypothetical protein